MKDAGAQQELISKVAVDRIHYFAKAFETGFEVFDYLKRNYRALPPDFMFELTKEEVNVLRYQNGTSSWGGSRYLPYVFTEQAQERVLEHLREYIKEIKDEANWNDSFAKSHIKLVTTAKQARKDVKSGKSEPMNLKKL